MNVFCINFITEIAILGAESVSEMWKSDIAICTFTSFCLRQPNQVTPWDTYKKIAATGNVKLKLTHSDIQIADTGKVKLKSTHAATICWEHGS